MSICAIPQPAMPYLILRSPHFPFHSTYLSVLTCLNNSLCSLARSMFTMRCLVTAGIYFFYNSWTFNKSFWNIIP